MWEAPGKVRPTLGQIWERNEWNGGVRVPNCGFVKIVKHIVVPGGEDRYVIEACTADGEPILYGNSKKPRRTQAKATCFNRRVGYAIHKDI